MRRRTWALAVTCALLTVACSGGSDPVADGTGAPSRPPPAETATPTAGEAATASPPSPSPSPEPVPSASRSPSPTPASRALGFESVPAELVPLPADVFPLQLSPDGTQLVVDAPDPDGVGCEGPPTSLQRWDLVTGELAPALDARLGANDVAPLLGDEVLLQAACEGFVAAAWVATQQRDGTFVDVAELPLPTGPNAGSDTVALAPGPAGLFTLVRLGGEGDPALLTIDRDGEQVGEALALDQVHYALTPTAETVYAYTFEAASGGAVIDLRRGELLEGYDDLGTRPGVEGALLAGDRGVALAGPSGLARWIDDPAADEVVWALGRPVDATRALVVEDPFGVAALHVVGPEGVIETIDAGVEGYLPVMLSADGHRLAYVVDDGVSLQVVLRDLP